MKHLSPIEHISYKDFPEIWVKRDDLIDPYISGNKWRKLKYILSEAKNKKKSHLITFGGAYSNHLVATAAAGARNGLQTTAFVRGEEVKNEMLLLCKMFGMKLIFVDRERYRHKDQLFSEYFEDSKDAFFIDEGGASEEAVIGCAEIISELDKSYDYIFCAAGTGTTAAGLLRGLNEIISSSELHIVPVLKGGEFINTEIKNYERNTDRLKLHTQYHFGGYAKTDHALLAFMKDFTAQTGLLIDPVYTAKMFYAIYDLIEKKELKQDSKILAIHTGGLLGILGMKEKLYSSFNITNNL
ncbi:MAG: 1-aminocyclopropane-1-carboxylate deaminase/D-cysteine desulfhydrase [Pedobacter sp.]|nr:MAG: 1-aminocyclopropane-1-carboxylate deaminase/D-cysteine desulfhydrase [Pedobacter sp.]